MCNHETSEQVRAAIGAHGAWKLKLKTAITTGIFPTDPAKAGCDDQCDFGRWLYSANLDEPTRSGKPYQVVKRLHAEFHICAGRVLALALSGKAAEATALFEGEYDERSATLVRALTKWRGELQQGIGA
jgi:hypothetical protein